MTLHEENVRKYHAALHRLCGMPALSATLTDLMTWDTFLLEMKPLDETEEGGFTLADLTAVLSMMAKQKREGIGWSMRPFKILQHPEQFRDLILQCRKDMKIKRRGDNRPPVRRIIQQLPNGTTRITDDQETAEGCTTAGAAAAATFADLRKQAGLPPPRS